MISVCMHYYNRRKLLISTLNSFLLSENINDTEFVIVDDASSDENKIHDLPELFPTLKFKLFRYEPNEKTWLCPVIPCNKSISLSTGDIIIIQNPECIPMFDILKYTRENIKLNDYMCYNVYALNENQTTDVITKFNLNKWNTLVDMSNATYRGDNGWYQHNTIFNRGYNFSCAIHKEDLDKCGWFDERFSDGIAWADAEFIERLKFKKMNIVAVPNVYCYHLCHEHDDSYLYSENCKKNYTLLMSIKSQYHIETNVHDGRINS